jgi:hypothetical protein
LYNAHVIGEHLLADLSEGIQHYRDLYSTDFKIPNYVLVEKLVYQILRARDATSKFATIISKPNWTPPFAADSSATTSSHVSEFICCLKEEVYND